MSLEMPMVLIYVIVCVLTYVACIWAIVVVCFVDVINSVGVAVLCPIRVPEVLSCCHQSVECSGAPWADWFKDK